ncbi:MAG: glycosyltransferase family 39 protein [Candidatus Kerfeldbacteria bacterium]|nr:glycosyltransferase family 39 protein [Candidatus Kerfeldbacteria bacterium]
MPFGIKNFFIRHKLILLLLLAVMVNELVFVMVVPLWQNYDEIEHYAYTAFLVEERRLPIAVGVHPQTDATLTQSDEMRAADALLENSEIIEAASMRGLVQHQDFDAGERSGQALAALAGLDRRTSLDNYQNPTYRYPPLYYALEAIPYLLFYHADIITRSYAMRAFNIIFLLLTVFFAYQLARRVLTSHLGALTVAALIGFMPRLAYTASGLNNDHLLITFGTLLVYLLVKYLSEKMQWQQALWLGLIFAGGVLTKPQFIVFAVPLGIFYLIQCMRERNFRRCAAYALIIVGVTLAIAGWWFFSDSVGQIGSSQITGLSNFDSATVSGAGAGLMITAIVLRYFYMFLTYFSAFGCCHEFALGSLYQVLFAISAGLGFFGLVHLVVTRRQQPQSYMMQMLLLCIFIVALEGLLLLIFLKSLLTTGIMPGFPIDGRYLFPVIAPLTILLVVGLQKLLPQKFHRALYLSLTNGIILINVCALFFYILPRYYL